MERLSPLDNAFLEVEDADAHTSMAIGSVTVFEGPQPSYEEFVAAIGERLALVPRYRQKVRRVPMDLGAPSWVDDPDFNLRWHVRPVSIPAPGDDAALHEVVGRLVGLRMDRTRPLWEIWLASGLSGGRWAAISKVHHCMVDGVSGTDMYRVLLDLGPDRAPVPADEWVAHEEPSTARLTADALRDLVANPFAQIAATARLIRHPAQAAHDVVDLGKGVARLGAALRPTSDSQISGEIGRRRRYITARASLADVRDIRLEFGGTVNDVVLTAIAAGFRDLMLARGEEPQPHSVRSLVPVSVRPPGAESVRDNQVSLLLARLPVHLADPVERLAAVCEELAQLKKSKQAQAGAAITSLARHEPFPLVSLPIRAAMRMAQHSVVTVTTNVPGPNLPLFGLGRRVLEIAPYVPIASTLRIGVAIFSYDGQLTFGITGDYESAPDIDVLARGIERSVAELVAAARANGPREDRVLSGGRALFGYVGGDARLRRQVFR